MTGKLFEKLKREKGAVQIVEASFVFPVMFIILFFLLYMGNAHYIRAQVESIVVEKAIKGANYCADPLLQTMLENKKIPTLSELETKPYRYFSNMNDLEQKISTEVKNTIENSSSTMFRNMVPKVKTNRDKISKYTNYILYSTFSVEVTCEVQFPIRFLGKYTPVSMVVSARSEVAVNDTAEFIRNTDMVVDYLVDTGFGKKIGDIFAKINGFISKFANS